MTVGMEEGERTRRPRQGDHPTPGRGQAIAPTMPTKTTPPQGEDKPSPLLCLRSDYSTPGRGQAIAPTMPTKRLARLVLALRCGQDVAAIAYILHSPKEL